MNQIAVVILNYNTYQDTIRLVGELQNQTVADRLHIVVVDNDSPNGSYERLKPLEQELPNVVVLQTGQNLGYARGNNFGLRYLESHINPRYVAVLNNDVHLSDNCLEMLSDRYMELDSPAVIAPRMVDTNGNYSKFSRMNTYLDDIMSMFFVFRLFPLKREQKIADNTSKKAMMVDMIPGSFMFADFNTFKEMGFFYPNTFLYVEERFVAMAAKKKRLQNYIITDQQYIHAHNSPTINSAYNQIEKYKLLYRGWREFTRTQRKCGRLKVLIMKPLMVISLVEFTFIYHIKNLFCERK